MRIDFKQWGYDLQSVQSLYVSRVTTTADAFDADGKQHVRSEPLGEIHGPETWVEMEVAPFGAVIFLFEP